MKPFTTSLLLLAAAAATSPVRAQNITNSGATLTLSNGATLSTAGSFTNTNSGTLNMSSGSNSLIVGGNLVNASGATVVPGTASTVTLNGTAAQQLSLNNATLANLTVNNASGVTLPASSNGTIAGALTLVSGMVTTDQAATLTLADGATLTGEQTGRYVAGNLAALKTSVSGATTFPNSFVVTPAAAIANLSVTRTAGLGMAQVSYGTSASGGNQGIDRIWSTSAPLTNATVQVAWLSANDNGLTNLASSQLYARTSAPTAGSPWVRISGAQNAATTRTVTGTLASAGAVATAPSASFFTVSTSDAPLPVTLVSFTAERSGGAAVLKWTTASELNNDYFAVEMSVDGQAFHAIGRVAGHGSSSAVHHYTLSDSGLLTYATELVYYRLRQLDTSGAEAVSPVRPVRVVGAVDFAVAAFPNPHGPDGARLQVRTAQPGALTLAAYDATGRLLFSRAATVQAGTNAIAVPEAGTLATGMYYLKASQAGQSTVLKLARE